MPTILTTLTWAQRALLAHQGAIAVIGGNIANAATPGYARRRAELSPTPGDGGVSGGWGGGVDLTAVRSIRDQFIEEQFRRELSQSSWFEADRRQLARIESSLGSLDDSGLEAALDRFWNSWHDLAADPASTGARAVVREAARSLIADFKDVATRLKAQSEQTHREAADVLKRANAILAEIAALNVSAVGMNGAANDLDDRRTLLMDELARLTGAEFNADRYGRVSVSIGEVKVVERGDVRNLEIHPDDYGLRIGVAGSPAGAFTAIGGELGALAAVLNHELPDVRRRLDELAVRLADAVNEVHRTGRGADGVSGRNFFNPTVTGIANFQLSDELANDLSAIAASSSDGLGDNQTAIAIAELATAPIGDAGSTIADELRGILTSVGTRTAESEARAEGAKLAVQQAAAWRDSVSGVSVDEEMAQMVKFQHAFNAAAKVITLADKMLETIIALK